jgi:phosphatidyl-myo-inositol dimannoside synthase
MRERDPRFLVLLTDAYGSRGGIADFNVDLLQALATYPRCREVVVVPRIGGDETTLPDSVSYRREASGGLQRYVREVSRLLLKDRDFALVVCGHVNLLPFSAVAGLATRAPTVLIAHGVEVWQDPKRAGTRAALRSVAAVAAVSELTLKRFASWAPIARKRQYILPNALHLERYNPGPKRHDLLARYGIPPGSPVLLTMGRMSSAERYKGHDEILDLLPALSERVPRVRYLIVGDGDDRPRLQSRAVQLCVEDRVVFTGFVPEDEKLDHFRLADVYVMPSHGEGFGRVLVEAMACGVPVVASTLDAGGEVVRETGLGVALDPRDRDGLLEAIVSALTRGPVSPGDHLAPYGFEHFVERCHTIVAGILACNPADERHAHPMQADD